MRLKLLLAFIGILSLMLPTASAISLSITGPTVATLNNSQSVFLGNVGPGESFYVLASPQTANATGFVVNIGWDQLQLVNAPQGWTSQPSKLYANPMELKITVPASAPTGSYNLTLQATNVQNYSRLGNITVYARVNVTPNVFSVGVNPTVINAGPGQPTNIYVTINNTGISDDPFNISLRGLPAWNSTDQVVALHLTQSSYVYPVYVSTPGRYSFNLIVSSSTNPGLMVSYPIKLTARSSLLNDYGAVGQGVILSPVIFDPIYEMMMFLSYIYTNIIR